MNESHRRKPIRCAIYTRKSTEEGLEQDFNSLHAQREACEAYIASQKHEGWQVIRKAFDDGGFSGGSMDRPALKDLLAEIVSGGIDVVVVYKVDRLTRSLTDFAKIVDVFDRGGVSFVSVTQAFNTTTSMGRLTLNVLLSFAQFEREVTGERIRDKVAASKKKGLWMGGHVPLGYEKNGRTLTIREDEAETIRALYRLYLERRSVDAVKVEADRLGLRTRRRLLVGGKSVGGLGFSRGHIYRVLSNPLYAGKIEHKGSVHPGQHRAIVDQETFEAVQATLAANSHARLVKAYSKDPALLSGLLFDAAGNRFVTSHATKQGRRYRYYVNAGAARQRGRPRSVAVELNGPACRLPAEEIEKAVIRILTRSLLDERWLADRVHPPTATIEERRAVTAKAQDIISELEGDNRLSQRGIFLLLLSRVVLDACTMSVTIRVNGALVEAKVLAGSRESLDDVGEVTVVETLSVRRRGAEARLVVEGDDSPGTEPDPVLVKALGQARRWWCDLVERRYASLRELAAAYNTDERYVASVLRLAFLKPQLTAQALQGTQPVEVSLHRLLKARHRVDGLEQSHLRSAGRGRKAGNGTAVDPRQPQGRD